MKSNYGRKSSDSKDKKQGLVEKIKAIIVQDFDEAIKEHGEDKALDILMEIASDTYTKTITATGQDIRAYVKRCVVGFVSRVSKDRMEDYLHVDTIQDKDDETLKLELSKLATIKKSINTKNRTDLDELIEKYVNEIVNRKISKKQETSSIPEQQESQVQKQEPEQNEETKKKVEEVHYYETVALFTRNFSFLAEDEVAFYTKTGGISTKRFANFEEYNRFNDLRNTVKLIMKNGKVDEAEAIRIILNDEEELKVADKKILTERCRVIARQKEKEIER